MGKGLGCLQKAVLLIAYEKHKQDPNAIIRPREILIKYYGFSTSGSEPFDTRAIGLKRYSSATVTVSQCFSRLVTRGLVEYDRYCSIKITKAGLRQARKILVQTPLTPAPASKLSNAQYVKKEKLISEFVV